jgi:hypothetical protein
VHAWAGSSRQVVVVEAAAILVVDLLACVSNEVKLPFDDLATICCTDKPKLLIDKRIEELCLDEVDNWTGEWCVNAPPLKVRPSLDVKLTGDFDG